MMIKRSMKRVTFTLWMTLFCAIVGVAYWVMTNHSQQLQQPMAEHSDATTTSSEQNGNELSYFESLSQDQITQMQVVANKAALSNNLITAGLHAPIERPEFVSPIEWAILKQVASTKADPDAQLLLLLKDIRFNKRYEWWTERTNTDSPTQINYIATLLLDEIPFRVNNGLMGISQAQQLQRAIIEETSIDDQQKRERMAQEAKKIGVTYDIERL